MASLLVICLGGCHLEDEAVDNNIDSVSSELAEQVVVVDCPSYRSRLGSNIAIPIIKNDSDKTLSVTTTCSAYGDKGELLKTVTLQGYSIAPNSKTCLVAVFDPELYVDHYECSVASKVEEAWDSVTDDIDVEYEIDGDEVDLTCTNEGSVPAKNVMAYVLFYQGDDLIEYGCASIGDEDGDNYKLEVGQTFTTTLESFEIRDFDRVEVYLTGWYEPKLNEI